MSCIKLVCISLLVLCATVAATVPSSADVFPNSSRQNLLRSELEFLSCDKLWLARNEIYARNGFRFSSERGIKAFGKGGNTKSPRLSDVERFNIARIEQVEYAKGC